MMTKDYLFHGHWFALVSGLWQGGQVEGLLPVFCSADRAVSSLHSKLLLCALSAVCTVMRSAQYNDTNTAFQL